MVRTGERGKGGPCIPVSVFSWLLRTRSLAEAAHLLDNYFLAECTITRWDPERLDRALAKMKSPIEETEERQNTDRGQSWSRGEVEGHQAPTRSFLERIKTNRKPNHSGIQAKETMITQRETPIARSASVIVPCYKCVQMRHCEQECPLTDCEVGWEVLPKGQVWPRQFPALMLMV